MAGPAVQMGGWVAADVLAGDPGHAPGVPSASPTSARWSVVGPPYAVADLRGVGLALGLTRLAGVGLAHLAFMPDVENRLSLLLKWMWVIGTRERDSMLIIGNRNQHMGVEVGLEATGVPTRQRPRRRPLPDRHPQLRQRTQGASRSALVSHRLPGSAR
jgi:NADH dehydrogenase